MKRYTIIARGSTEHPDLNEQTDDVPDRLNWKYPFVSIVRNNAVELEDLKASIQRVQKKKKRNKK